MMSAQENLSADQGDKNMVLVVDKFRPKSFEDLTIHPEINQELKQLVEINYTYLYLQYL